MHNCTDIFYLLYRIKLNRKGNKGQKLLLIVASKLVSVVLSPAKITNLKRLAKFAENYLQIHFYSFKIFVVSILIQYSVEELISRNKRLMGYEHRIVFRSIILNENKIYYFDGIVDGYRTV